MYINKKGIDISFQSIIYLILILVFAVAFLAYIRNELNPAQEEFFDISACQLSVQKSTLPGLGITSLEELSGCKTQEIITNEIEPEYVKDLLAKSLYNCWLMFGQGKLNFLKDFEGEQKKACFICSKIKFKNEVDELNPGILRNYLAAEDNYKGIYQFRENIDFDKINKDTTLYTVIVAAKDRTSIDSFTAISYISGYTPDFYASIALKSPNYIKNTCTSIR